MKYSCTRINFNKILLLIAIVISTQTAFAFTTRSSSRNTEHLAKNINSIFLTPYYTAYIETGGFKFLGTSSHLKGAIDADVFIPLWQRKNELLFTDIRGVRQTNYIYEGNIHIGYRRLYPEYKTIFGIYGAFDRKKTEYGNYYNQLMLGGEYWIKRLFLGANVYYPIGTTEKRKEQITDRPERGSYRSVWYNASSEKAMPGVDAEIGYELADGLIAYAGGYYFKTDDIKAITGPQFKIEKIFYARQKSRFLGIIDALTLEGEIKYDKERGKRITLGVKLRLGPPFQGAPNLKSFERHMMDPVRRDLDIVSVSP